MWRPDPPEYIARWSTLLPCQLAYAPHLGDHFHVGLLYGARLGDTIITSGIPERLNREQGLEVTVVHYPTTLQVFAHNPHVTGYLTGGRIDYGTPDGIGHLIQRVERFLGLEPEPWPRGRLHFNQQELLRASALREHVVVEQRSQRLALVSTAATTHLGEYAWVPWVRVVATLRSAGYAVVHTALCSGRRLSDLMRIPPDLPADPVIDGAFRVEDLPCRDFLALLATADLAVVTASGSSHAAAASDVPAVVLWPQARGFSQFRPPVSGYPGRLAWLYPQHAHIAPPA